MFMGWKKKHVVNAFVLLWGVINVRLGSSVVPSSLFWFQAPLYNSQQDGY